MSNTNTDFSSRCSILGDLWLNYKSEPEFEDFIEYNDIGLPLAFAISQEIIPASDMATKYVNETWDLFLESLGLPDAGFTSLNELLDNS
jgi:hypothetical protein